MRWISLVIIVCSITVIADCIDSDGGKDPSASGNVTYDGNTYSDSCVDSQISEGRRLEEHYCKRGVPESVYIECDVRCYAGRCIDEEELKTLNSCEDSDSGMNQHVKGTIEGRVNINSEKGVFTDYCLVGHKDMLMEYHCNEDGFVTVEMVKCDDGCKDGACEGGTHGLQCLGGTFAVRSRCSDEGESSVIDTLGCPGSVACCPSQSQCLVDGACIDEGSEVMLGGGTVFCRNGYLSDCDLDEGSCEDACGLHWAKLGEPRFIGEYDREVEDCCGDDSTEHYIVGEDNTSACCDKPTDYVSQGICHKNSTGFKVNMTKLKEELEALYRPPANKTAYAAVEENSSKRVVKANSSEDAIKVPYNPPDPVSKGIFKRLFSFILQLFR